MKHLSLSERFEAIITKVDDPSSNKLDVLTSFYHTYHDSVNGLGVKSSELSRATLSNVERGQLMLADAIIRKYISGSNLGEREEKYLNENVSNIVKIVSIKTTDYLCKIDIIKDILRDDAISVNEARDVVKAAIERDKLEQGAVLNLK